MRLRAWAATDVGILRDHNEDSHLVNNELGLLVVADGMGGHAAGEIASSIAVKTVEEVVAEGLAARRKPGTQPPTDVPIPPRAGGSGTMVMAAAPLEQAGHQPAAVSPKIEGFAERLLADAVRKASAAILDVSEQNPDKANMGTTVSAVLMHDGRAYFAHVGDSRLYHAHNGVITQVSEDHSLVQQQIKAGLLTAEDARRSRYRNIITRSVGFDRHIDVDTGEIPVSPGDRLLLCSDGLSNLVRESELFELVTNHPPETCLRFCINLANSRGGDDNITVIVADVTE